jgi:hypothetical protein
MVGARLRLAWGSGVCADRKGMDQRAELTKQLRNARAWILVVGVLVFAVDMFVIYVLWNDHITVAWRDRLTIYDAMILAYFIALWWFAQYRPVLCCVLALAGFWALQAYLAVVDPSTLGQLFIVKVLFTIALIKGIQSARRAERLRRELTHVFG